MKKQITLGLIASALALSTAAFAPTEAQANDRNRQLNQLAMQMYMNNQAIAAQQQYNNQYLYNNPYNNGYYNQVNNGCYRPSRWNNSWNNGYYNNGYNNGLGLSSVGRFLNRIF